jgi:hypothetical protein
MPVSYARPRLSRPVVREEDEVSRSSSDDRALDISSRQTLESRLIVARQDITFTDVDRDRVQIAITVTNAGASRSRSDLAIVRAAPFGAFVNWQMLTALPVPPLDPGESTVLRTDAGRVFPRPAGSPDRVSPGRLLTAMDSGDPNGPGVFSGTWWSRLTKKTRSPFSRPERSDLPSSRVRSSPRLLSVDVQAAPQPPPLPASPFDMLTGSDTYWAGNLNVFIGGTDVERHMAKALRIVPGCTNAAMFIVGDGNVPDWYRFDLIGLGPDWQGGIFNPMLARSLQNGVCEGTRIEPGTWNKLSCRSLLLLALKPPARCDLGNVEIHVTQRSTERTAVVEFSFDPRALGPGCYVVK